MDKIKLPKIRGLRHRWMQNSILVVSILVVALIVIFSVFSANNYYSTVQLGLTSKAKTAADFFAAYITRTYAEYYESAYRYTETFDDSGRLELQFIDPEGRVLVSSNAITSGNAPGTKDISDALAKGEISVWVGRNNATGERIMAVSAPMKYSEDQVIGVMRYVTSLRLVDRLVIINTLFACGVGLLVLIIVICTNLMFIKSVIQPVGDITMVAGRIAEGSYGVQIERKYKDEIGDMVNSINEMSLKIAKAEKIQTEFISSVSHELRTPLTAIAGWGETLLYNENLDSESRHGIAIILKESRRLSKMVEELLEFTRMEDGRFTLNIEQIDIVAEVEDAIFTYKELLQHDKLELEYKPYVDELPLIPGDPNRLRQVFFNLLDNAAKYASDGNRITVSLEADASFVSVIIRDYGPGVPEDELEHIKMKFYKGSNSKGRGSGIGLAVCDEIVRYHGGSLDIENAEGGGLRVTVRLPLSSAI